MATLCALDHGVRFLILLWNEQIPEAAAAYLIRLAGSVFGILVTHIVGTCQI